MTKTNNNIWDGKFREKELRLYPNLNQKDINLIMEYQKLLPILQQDNNNWINTRDLHSQLKLSRQYDKWIKNIIEQLDLQEEDIKSLKTISKNKEDGRPKTEFYVRVDIAKEISMISGIGNRVNKETKHISKIARKYFITIEKAFKSRYEWNKDRLGSIEQFKNLRKIIFTDLYGENRLGDFIPAWWKVIESKTGLQNSYAYELYKLDLIIIGKSAKKYREENNIPKGTLIRNTFNENQLEEFELLQGKSAEYLTINKVWNTEKRVELLTKWLELHREGKIL